MLDVTAERERIGANGAPAGRTAMFARTPTGYAQGMTRTHPTIWDRQIPLAAGALLALFGFLLGYGVSGMALQLNPFAAEHPAHSPLVKMLVWALAVAIGCGCRRPLAELLHEGRRSPLLLVALAFVPVVLADVLASQFAVAISGYPTCAPGAPPLPPFFSFLPRAAILGTAVLLSLLAWGHYLARRAAEDAAELAPIMAYPQPERVADSGDWLDLPESPLLRLRAQDVVLIRSAGNYSEIVANGRAHLVRATLTELSHRFAPLGFVRVHRQTMVNARQVREIRRDPGGRTVIELLCGVSVSPGRSYVRSVEALC